MAKCGNCIHQYVCEKRTCAECVGIYCDECEIYCQYDGKPDIENCKDFINENDVVPVVRCKDCKYLEDRLYCRRRKEHPYIVTNTDFCSYGERSADNDL